MIDVRHLPGAAAAGRIGRGTTAVATRSEVEPLPGEPVLVTRAAGAFRGTPLSRELSDREVDTVIMAGLMSADGCTATAREAIERRLRTVLSCDATAARAGGAEPRTRPTGRSARSGGGGPRCSRARASRP